VKLPNKNALITGGSSGIGQAIAVAFASEGANVIFSFHENHEGALETLDLIGSNGIKKAAVHANLANTDSLHNLVGEALNYLETIDILVNNAGIVARYPNFLDITLEALEEINLVNLSAPFVLTQQVAGHMKENNIKGSIINISSVSAEITSPGLAHYECSKAALNALTRGAASDLARFNIRVNAIAPGLVATNINKAQRENDPSAWQARSSKIPLGRVGKPNDIAGMAVFLGSDEAEWMTGTIIPFDGGLSVISPFRK
jgi:NAD(P)-dependent dehydrogenase (short-subunit alcohol dehydrogenase family)